MFIGAGVSRIVRLSLLSAMAAIAVAATTVSFAAIELPADKAGLIELGRQHRTAFDLFKEFAEKDDR